MYYYYREYDPVLQKLSNSTVSALYDQNIICVEDLFDADDLTVFNTHE